MTGPSCRVCGRRLADPASRARGIGPICAKAAKARAAVHIPTPHPPEHVPGQAELPLIHHQPTLWSA
ncbi:DUF6011 domain-containing protein [Streptomyces sp. NPDC015184]|uniref:DUF6011 domain-containing protein n=1 Tax=Streptomyces sp. NPDC015184 TaxID=3364946 RepID=UPI0037000FC1